MLPLCSAMTMLYSVCCPYDHYPHFAYSQSRKQLSMPFILERPPVLAMRLSRLNTISLTTDSAFRTWMIISHKLLMLFAVGFMETLSSFTIQELTFHEALNLSSFVAPPISVNWWIL